MAAGVQGYQPSLIGWGDPPSFNASLAGIKRTPLGGDAWIDHLPRCLGGHWALYEHLAQSLRWHHQERKMYDRIVDVPRLTASIPRDGRGHAVLDRMARALSIRYGVAFDSISLAHYRDGRDSVAWHGDRVRTDSSGNALVAILSVGEPRRFLLRPLGRGESHALSLGWGDLVVMGGSCQRTWQHSVPKAANAGPRISIMFRCSAYSLVERSIQTAAAA